MNAREVSWRVFAEEYASSNMEHSGEGEKPVSYIVTPLGARVNRMLVVGVVTEIEEVGEEGKPRYRARVADQTGEFYVSGGEYQPEAAAALAKISPPAFVAIVGKSRAYSPEPGVKYLSIRPERISEVDAGMRDNWVLETAKSTLNRIDAMQEALNMSEPTAGELMKLGYSESLSEGVVLALDYYREVDLDRFRGVVKDALRTLLPESGAKPKKAAPAQPPTPTPQKDVFASVEVPEMPEKDKDAETADEELQELEVGADEEEVVLGIIDSLDNGSKGAQWDKIVDEATKKKKIDKVRLEEIVANLLDKGEVYEPELGMMKRI
jgi:RPA family protein